MSANIHSLKDLKKKDPLSDKLLIVLNEKSEVIQEEKSAPYMWKGRYLLWNGRVVHSAGGHVPLAAKILVETFMLALGFYLIATSFTILGCLVILPTLFAISKTMKNFGTNEMREGLGRILGSVEAIDKLPILDVNSENVVLDHSIMRIVKDGQTQDVVFNFDVSPYQYTLRSEGTHETVNKTWVFMLQYDWTMGNQHNKQGNEEETFKNYIFPHEGVLLERLVQNKGVWTEPDPKGYAYRMTKPVNWNELTSKE